MKPPQPASRPVWASAAPACGCADPCALTGQHRGAAPDRTHACARRDAFGAKQQGAGAGAEQKKLDRNALSACGDSARATAGSQAHDRELDPRKC